MDEKEKKITWLTAFAMVSMALIFDVFSIIPIVGGLLAMIAYGIEGAWLWFLGHGIVSAKKLAAPVISIVIEFIPAVSALPSITLATIATLIIIKGEEVTGINVGELAKGDIKEGLENTKNGKGGRTLSRRNREIIRRESQDGNILTPKRSPEEKRIRRSDLQNLREVT